jgi:hypothetical protein
MSARQQAGDGQPDLMALAENNLSGATDDVVDDGI